MKLKEISMMMEYHKNKNRSLTYVTICIDSDYRSDKTYHPQTSFHKCKYVATGNKILKNFDY